MNARVARSLAAPVCLALIACSGGSGGDAPPPLKITNDLSSSGHQVLTQADQIEVAHPIRIQVAITALEQDSDVPIGFALLNKADVDADKDEVRQFETETRVIEHLDAGKSSHNFELKIPEELDPAGDYYLICHVDPQDVIPETNEENNLPTTSEVRRVVVTVREDKRAVPDIVLESAVCDAQIIPLNPLDDGHYPERNNIKDHKNHHCGITALISTTGAKVLPEVEIQVYVELSPGQLRPLGIWEGDATQGKGYLETHVIKDLSPDEPVSLELGLRVPAQLRAEIIKLIGQTHYYKLPIIVAVNPRKKVVEYEESVHLANRTDDNRIRFDAVFTRPQVKAGPGYVDYQKCYEKAWTKKSFGVALSHQTRLRIQKEAYDVEVTSSIPVTIFGHRFEFLRLVGSGHGVAPQGKVIEPDRIPVDYRLEFAGTTIYRPGYSELKAKGTLDFWIQKDFPVDAKGKKGYKKTIVVYGVPVEVKAWATGKLGVIATLKTARKQTPTELTAMLGVDFGPYASIGVSATGTANLGVVKPGVGTSLTLLTERLIASSSGTLKVVGTVKPKITMDFEYALTNEVEGPKGKFWVFVKYRAYKWFMKSRWRTAKKPILRWKTFVKRDVLINKKETLDFQL